MHDRSPRPPVVASPLPPVARRAKSGRERRPAAGRTRPPPRNIRAADLPRTLWFGGHRETWRFLRPDDDGRLLDFFASHTPETIHDRYGYLFAQMLPSRAKELVGVNQSRDVALGVFEGSGAAARLVAIGRYCLDDDGRSAETAFVVREDRRGLGIATTLLRALVAMARERGLGQLTAQVQSDNAPMLAIFRKLGANVTEKKETGAKAVVLEF